MKLKRNTSSKPEEYIETNESGQLKCEMCDGFYDHLSSHINKGHNIKVKKYKVEFGLPFNMGLISRSVRSKKRQAVKEKPTWKENFQKGEEHEFKPGEQTQRRTTPKMVEKRKKRLDKMNDDEPQECPVCDKTFQKLGSHLYNKHSLIKVEK